MGCGYRPGRATATYVAPVSRAARMAQDLQTIDDFYDEKLIRTATPPVATREIGHNRLPTTCKVGKDCELAIAREYRVSVESKTFYSPHLFYSVHRWKRSVGSIALSTLRRGSFYR